MSEKQHAARVRALYSAATAASLLVAVVFATVGDGVEVAEATGLRAVVIEGGHTLVWVLLTIAFAIAAVRARWSRLSSGVAIAAGISYAVFLIAVFLWR